MKFKGTVILLTVVVTMGLLLGASAAQAVSVDVDETGTNATAIRNLEVDGVFYDVVFLFDTANNIWGPVGSFDFPTALTATTVAAVMGAVLNTLPDIVTVGPDMEGYFRVPFERLLGDNLLSADEIYILDDAAWTPRTGASIGSDTLTYAKFTEVTEPPDEFTIGGNVTGLVGSGLVLQNNGGDDKPIDGDGDFTFDTPLAAGSAYDVTVKTQPSNPAQTCVVENGRGTVPTENVTNVGVTCETVSDVIVETDEDGNVIRIRNLEVFDNASDSIIVYNVDFVEDTAINVYGSGLEFDFPISEDALAASVAVRDALNAWSPVPPGAGPQGSDQFFIGSDEQVNRVLAVGSEFIVGFWDDCKVDCVGSTAVLGPDVPFTYADFTVVQDVAPGEATLISPRGRINDNTPTYTWNAVENATRYYLWVNETTKENPRNRIKKWYPADDANCGGGRGECSVTPEVELTDGDHRWWIQTSNDFGDGPWSLPLDFTVDTGTGVLPGEATLISPIDTITENNPTYTWSAVETSTWYYLWVNDSTGKNRIKKWYPADAANCGDGSGECSVTHETKLADGASKWWIQTYNDFGVGPWSARMDFTVDTGTSAPPGKATLISPSGTITDNTPTYTWNADQNATWYRLWVDDSTGENRIKKWYPADNANCGDGTGECSVAPNIELADGQARWWIQTWNEFAIGRWSAGLSFTVNTDTVDPGVGVETDVDGNVIRITNLPVVDEKTGETTIYNVDFIFGTVTDVYGSGLNFDFTAPEDDETIIVALAQVLNALNFTDPIPPAAGSQATDQFFIGYTEEDGLIVAVGGENILGAWNECEADCVAGVTLLAPDTSFTWADFTVAD